MHYAEVDPAAIVAASLAVAEVQARRKGVTCLVDEQPHAHIQADASKMEQVLNNLVLNAIEHSKPGDIVRLSTSFADGDWLVIVKDCGTGIEPSDLARLFSPFERGSAAKTAGEKSTGLGLAITKKIVEGHGGRIAVESSPGIGTTFTVRIPISRPTHP
jgi:signal transduction histidine kinase